MGTIKVIMLLGVLSGLLMVVGYLVARKTGVIVALVLSALMNLGSYWYSDTIVLKMYNAQPVAERDAPALFRAVEALSAQARIPMPRIYVVPSQTPNAFATGRNPEHAAVAATTGILHLLSARELRGVMAHELSHVAHRDILISTISATMAGAISALANFAMLFGGRSDDGRPANPLAGIAVALLAPLAASLIQMAISRSREYEADRGGAEISGDPNALADALGKIQMYAEGRIPLGPAEAHPETAQMMILNPLSAGGIKGLFSTHPPTEERIARLRAMAV